MFGQPCSSPMIIVRQLESGNTKSFVSGADNIIAALGCRGHVCKVCLPFVSSRSLEGLATLMQELFARAIASPFEHVTTLERPRSAFSPLLVLRRLHRLATDPHLSVFSKFRPISPQILLPTTLRSPRTASTTVAHRLEDGELGPSTTRAAPRQSNPCSAPLPCRIGLLPIGFPRSFVRFIALFFLSYQNFRLLFPLYLSPLANIPVHLFDLALAVVRVDDTSYSRATMST